MILLKELDYIGTGDTLADKLEKTIRFLSNFEAEILAVGEHSDLYGKKVTQVLANSIASATMAALGSVRRVYQSEKNNTLSKK